MNPSSTITTGGRAAFVVALLPIGRRRPGSRAAALARRAARGAQPPAGKWRAC